MLPSLKTAYMAPGHNSVLNDDDGRMYVVYHQRFDSGTEFHEPRVHELIMTENGWPAAMPFNVSDEAQQVQTAFSDDDIKGKWYFLNHGTDISADIHTATETKIGGGSITGDVVSGSVKVTEGTRYVQIVSGDITYSGVIADMIDEAGNPVRCISAIGDNNESIWGVMYR